MPEQLGKYELLDRIGVGGMAEVFVARTRGAEGFVKQVVIKRILPAFSQDPRFVRMFINEAHLAARLQHANVVQIFDFDHVGDTYYIAMEWVEGSDLRRVQLAAERRRMPVPTQMAIHVGLEALKGLHYAHTKTDHGQPLNIVHRDISPHNLLVSFSGEVKIADFGIAKAASLLSSTRAGAVKGKLPYMAPEQLDAAAVDARTDLFALGIVLWELVAGRRLYAGAGSAGELASRVRRCEIPLIREAQPDAPEQLEAVLARLLAPAPDARYQSAAEALAELSHLGAAGDAIAVGDYLRRLLPAEAARELRGQTVVEPADFREATPGAETRTRPSSVSAADTSLAPTELGESQAAAEAEQPAPAAGAAHGWRLAAAAVVVALLCAAGAWLLLAPATPHAARTAEVTLDTDPATAQLWIDDWPAAAQRPLVIGGDVGSVVNVRARAQDRVVSRRIRFGQDRSRILLRVPDPAPGPASAPAPVAPRTDPAPVRAVAARPAAVPTARPRARGWATLNVIVEPWAHVKVDGRSLGTTPVRDHRISAGRHRVELSNEELDRKEKLRVAPAAGEVETIRRSWLP